MLSLAAGFLIDAAACFFVHFCRGTPRGSSVSGADCEFAKGGSGAEHANEFAAAAADKSESFEAFADIDTLRACTLGADELPTI